MSNVSVLVWANLEDVSDEQAYLYSLGTNLYYRYNAGYDFIYNKNLEDTGFVIRPSALDQWNWTNMGFVYDGEKRSVFKNGFLLDQEYVGGEIFFDPFNEWVIGHNYAHSGIHSWKGFIDEMMIFNRTLSDSEIFDIVNSTGLSSVESGHEINLTLVGSDFPDELTFFIHDDAADNVPTRKQIFLNGQLIWGKNNLKRDYQLFNLNLSQWLVPGSNELVFLVGNGKSRNVNVSLYFVEDYWRNGEWEMKSNSGVWEYVYTPDLLGDLGPHGLYLDYRVHSPSNIKRENIERTLEEGSTFAYYTTGTSTRPIILYNRFFNGIYASAVGANSVYNYAYSSVPMQPYDDMFGAYVYKTSEPAVRGQTNYQLILQSWDQRVYNTLVYESMREGIEDSKIIALLKSKIAGSNSDVSREAESYLDGIFDSLSRDYIDYRGKSITDPIEERYNGEGIILEDLSEDSEGFDFFDGMRMQMVNYIILLESEGKGSNPPSNPGGGDDPPSSGGGDDPPPDNLDLESDCEEDWFCEDWGECIDGFENRECEDLNYCGTVEDRPILERDCENSDFQNGFGELIRYDTIFVWFISGTSILGIGILAFLIIRALIRKDTSY